MKKTLYALLCFSLSILILQLPMDQAWCQTNLYDEMFKSFTALELQVKIVMKDDASSSSETHDPYTGELRGRSESQDKLNVTIEGTFRFKPYEVPLTPPPGWPSGVPYPPVGYCPPGFTCPPTTPTYPRGPLLIPDEANTPTPTISGNGDGNSSGWWLQEDCRDDEPSVCQDFKQEGTSSWQYRTVDSVYAKGRPIEGEQDGMVRDLLVRQLSADAPVSYTFDLWPVGIGDYVKASGSGTTTIRNYEVNETNPYTIEDYGATRGRSWTEFEDDYPKITGNLTLENGRAVASGNLVKSYSYTSADGDLETGTAEVFYTIRALLSTDQPIDQSELGCPDGKCKQNGGTSSPGSGYGAPTWSVNMANLNIFVTDTPLWYRSPIGPPVEVTVSYNAKAPETQFEPVGRKWQLNYESFLSSDQATGDVTITMPDGKRDVYAYNAGNFTAPYRVFNDLKITRQGGLFDGNDYDLTFPDGTVYVYKVPAWSYRWAFLSEIRDSHGNKLSLQWEGVFPFGGKLKQITDALGRATVFTQDDNNRITLVQDPFGRTASFGYDLLGRLTRITDMGGYVTTLAYSEGVLADDFSQIRRMVQGNNTWEFTPDANGLTVTDNLGVEKFVLNAEQGGASFQGANAQAGETYAYKLAPANDGSKHKDVTGIETPEKISFDFAYDAKGNVLTDTLKAATGDETVTFTYNSKGKVTSIQDAMKSANALRVLTYYANNVDLKELKNGLGSITAMYNDKHDITAVTDRLGHTKGFEYNDFGQLVKTTDAIGQTVFVYDDTAHQVVRIERDGVVIGILGYDHIGRVNSYTNADGFTTTYTYNDLDDLQRVTYPDSTFKEYVYSTTTPHQLDSMTNPSRTTHYTYNAHKQLRKILIDEAEGWSTEFEYYPAGTLKKIIDPNLHGTLFEYDRDGRVTQKTLADGKMVRFAYANGRLSRFTNTRGITTDYTYDKNGNMRTINYSDATPGVILSYDDYNRLIRVDDGLGAYLLTYDANSRLKTIDGPWESDTLTYDYDARSRKTSISLEKGLAAAYSYDGLDRPTTVTGTRFSYSYLYQGGSTLLQRLNRPDESWTEYGYDPTMKRLERYTHRDRTGGVLNEHTFAYDALGQPTNETVTNGPALQFPNPGEETATYNDLNQVLTLSGSAAFSYDFDGNMTQGLTGDGRPFTATYDAENRLASIQYTDGGGVLRRQEYLYGYDGFMGIQKNYGDGALTGEQRFIRDGGKVLQERNGDNNVVRDYLWGHGRAGGVGALLALSQGEQTYQYFSSPRGDITAVVDSSGAVAAAYAYDPFGVPLATSGTLQQPIRFSTKAYDEGTGLYYYGYRFYAPRLGRWLSRDPLAEKGSLNLYNFASNNPVARFDPFGAKDEATMDEVLNSSPEWKEKIAAARAVREAENAARGVGEAPKGEQPSSSEPGKRSWLAEKGYSVGKWLFSTYYRKKRAACSDDPKDAMELVELIELLPKKSPVSAGAPSAYGKLGQEYLEQGMKRTEDLIKEGDR